MHLFYRKLWVKIMPFFLVIVTLPLVLLGVLLINTSQEAIRNSVLNSQKEIAVRAADEITLFIDRAKDILNTTQAMLGVLYPAAWKQETVLVELVLNQPLFTRIASLDLTGKVIASSESARGLSWDYPEDVLQKIEGKDIYISEVELLDSNTPYVTMAVPIRKMGQAIGVLVAEANLREIWGIIDNIRLGKTGRAFLVSGDGTLIAHQDKKAVLKQENFLIRKDVRSALSGGAGSMETRDAAGERLISAYAYIPRMGWGIVLQQKQSEAYLFSKIMKRQSWTMVILGELIAVILSIFMARILTRPMKALVDRIKGAASGDLERRIETNRHDEIGELIRSFNDMTKKLKKAKEKEQFSLIGEASKFVAHELKNSLVLIKSFVQSFPREHNDDNFVSRFTRFVPGEISRWERMVKELSDISAQEKLDIDKANINELLAQTLDILSEEFSKYSIDVDYKRDNGDIYILADEERLKQVFINLIVNAINAMPQGGSLGVSAEPVKIAGLFSSAFNQIEVRIKDTGKGIPPEALGKIFNPFYTNHKGTRGLGLTISRKIVEQHGGSIEVESMPGLGTTFIVKLPKIARPLITV